MTRSVVLTVVALVTLTRATTATNPQIHSLQFP